MEDRPIEVSQPDEYVDGYENGNVGPGCKIIPESYPPILILERQEKIHMPPLWAILGPYCNRL